MRKLVFVQERIFTKRPLEKTSPGTTFGNMQQRSSKEAYLDTYSSKV